MPYVQALDGTRLYYEEVGKGTVVLFIHEFAGDYRTWEPQLRHFARSHRCITFSQRGYPPSDVPDDPARYSQDIARDDIAALLDGLGIEKAHIVGHSMGGYTALHFGIQAPQRCISVVAAGCGWGSLPDAERSQAMKLQAAETGKMFADGRYRGGRGEIRRRSDASGAQEQGSARLVRIRAHAQRAFRAGPFTDHVRRAA